MKKSIRKYAEWQQVLEGRPPIKWWRRPIAKFKYKLWKIQYALFYKKQR